MEPHDPYSEPDPVVDGDAVEHLWNAAHEMLRAMRTLLDAADEFVESQRGGRAAARNDPESRGGRVHHIDIDVRSDSAGPHMSSRDADADADSDPGAGSGVGAS